MSSLPLFLSPFNLLFFIILTGLAIGKIQIKHISLGIAGILFASMLVGFLMNLLIAEDNAKIVLNAQNTMKTFSRLGTSLFVSVIGLQTGFSIKNNSKSSIAAFGIGSIMSISGVAVMLLISVLDHEISYYSLLGILCGALTSTPGLSSVCELLDGANEETVLGYGCSYIVGVILVVFFAQLFSKNSTNNQTPMTSDNIKGKIYPELMLVCVVALLGNITGSMTVPILNISFGTTACTLVIGLLAGFLTKKNAKSNTISSQCLNIFRIVGLALFFTGTGFETGVQTVALDIKTVLYGMLISLFTILSGWALCRLVTAKYNLPKGFIIAGGMTSSPAYGALSYLSNENNTNCFSFAYFGALISLMAAIQIVGR